MAARWPFDIEVSIRVIQKIPRTAGLILALAFIAAWLVAFLFVFAWSTQSMAAGLEPRAQAGQQVRPVVRRCHTVTAQTYNKRVRLLREITGNPRRGTLTKGKRCKYGAYADLGRAVRKARADCLEKIEQTEASVFWPGRDSGGMKSACGYNLWTLIGAYGYAELGGGRYLGGLPCGFVLYINGPDGTVAARKFDTGGGSGSSTRKIDLWNNTAPAIGISKNGIGQVRYSRRNCWAR